jgi:hypothetical protein
VAGASWRTRDGKRTCAHCDSGMLTYAHVCSRMLTYADVCAHCDSDHVAFGVPLGGAAREGGGGGGHALGGAGTQEEGWRHFFCSTCLRGELDTRRLLPLANRYTSAYVSIRQHTGAYVIGDAPRHAPPPPARQQVHYNTLLPFFFCLFFPPLFFLLRHFLCGER